MSSSPLLAATRSLDESVFRPLNLVALNAQQWTVRAMSRWPSPTALHGDGAAAPLLCPLVGGALLLGGFSFCCGFYAKTAATQVKSWCTMASLWHARRSFPHASFTPTFATSLHTALHTQVLNRTGYFSCYSRALRAPVSVTFVVSEGSAQYAATAPRASHFVADKEIPSPYRCSVAAFRREGYDRGHMAPHSAVGCCRKSASESFLLSNVVLQHPKLNRKTWKALEFAVRRHVVNQHRRVARTPTSSSAVAVTVGPMFSPHVVRNHCLAVSEADNEEQPTCLVPVAFFMALYEVRSGKTTAFVASNDAKATVESMPLTQLEERLSRLYKSNDASTSDQQKGGDVRFFAQYRDAQRRTAMQGEGLKASILRRCEQQVHNCLRPWRLLRTLYLKHVAGVTRIDSDASKELCLEGAPLCSSHSIRARKRRVGRPSKRRAAA